MIYERERERERESKSINGNLALSSVFYISVAMVGQKFKQVWPPNVLLHVSMGHVRFIPIPRVYAVSHWHTRIVPPVFLSCKFFENKNTTKRHSRWASLGYQRISFIPVFVMKNKWVQINLNNKHCFRNLREKYIFP